MAKEVLKIGPSRIQVDYDFRNDSNEDVTTEVAFPIPPYANGPEEWPPEQASFSDFVLTVNDKPVKFQIEARAFLKGREVTSILDADKIDIRSFGHFNWQKDLAPEFSRLTEDEQGKLVKAGLFNPDERWGNWTVHLQYHWIQIFPAHSTVHIHHEYTPVRGFQLIPLGAIRKALHEPDPADRSLNASAEDMTLLNSFCPGSSFLHALESSMAPAQNEGYSYAHLQWVDFILTSANTWKQPIEDFTLIVERSAQHSETGDKTLVSFCSPEHADVKKLNEREVQVHLTDFVPRSELRIGFFDLLTQGDLSEQPNGP